MEREIALQLLNLQHPHLIKLRECSLLKVALVAFYVSKKT